MILSEDIKPFMERSNFNSKKFIEEVSEWICEHGDEGVNTLLATAIWLAEEFDNK